MLAKAEIKAIKTIDNQSSFVSIDHIGSTAVPGLSSKPIVDIFIGIQSIKDAERWVYPLQLPGSIYWEENPDTTHLRFLKKYLLSVKEGRILCILSSPIVIHLNITYCLDILHHDESARLDYDSLK